AEGEFEGQVAVVTGGAQGLGYAIARLLGDRGAAVCILDMDKARLDRAANELGQSNRTVRGYECDVTKEPAILKARDAILKEFGRADVLVNNAGIYPHATLREITVEAWDRMFDVNTKSMFLVTRAFMDSMIAKKYGRVVTIVTEDAYIPKPTIPHYAASKAALLSLIKTFAIELAPHQVLVNGVSPGAIATERAKSQSWLPRIIPQIPLGRAAEPEDMAEVVLFLASKRNRFVVGETIIASGGHLMY
ncbi:MAG: SDR family NAD(P)-dependent oxidoreductase, partial [Alphaproteobacteria bacterium]